MSNTDKPFGIDVSRYQGVIDWDAIAINAKKVVFAGIRAAISWAYTDPQFKRNYAEAKRVGIPRCAYHVFYPGEDPKRQMDHFISVMNGDYGDLAPALDVELSHDVDYQTFARNLASALLYLQSVTGKKPFVYSRASFIDVRITGRDLLHPNRTPPAWLDEYDWWLAQYLRSGEEHQGPPTLPAGVSREHVLIHQTSGLGEPFGVQSAALDYNRWQFDQAHLDAYVGVENSQEDETEVVVDTPIDLTQEVAYLREDIVAARDELEIALENVDSAIERFDLIAEG